LLLALTGASIILATSFPEFLPVLDTKGDFNRITTTGVAPLLEVITAAALIVLWRVTRFKTVLQIWLGVALVAMLCDNAITMMGAHRLSVGWYIGRFNALISAAVILFGYLAEINRAYFKSVNDAKDLTASFSALERKVDHVRIDQLTGLSGRALFLEQAEALLHAGTSKSTSTAVLFVDLDGFKRINDQFGHDRGDAVLAQTAAILLANLREGDVAGRIGGDEFVVCITAPSNLLEAVAKRVAARIVAKVAEIGAGIGCSIGIALSDGNASDLSGDLRHADIAMYSAKKLGKNRFTVYGRAELALVMEA
jgi:diguanylate cyclase (GGDEF)-like protein